MAEGHSQYGCHGAVPDQHDLIEGVNEKDEVWDNPAADGVDLSFKWQGDLLTESRYLTTPLFRRWYLGLPEMLNPHHCCSSH